MTACREEIIARAEDALRRYSLRSNCGIPTESRGLDKNEGKA